MATKRTKQKPAKGSGVARNASEAKGTATLAMTVEAILANQERAKRLYQRAGEDLAALVKVMRAGQTVSTRFGTVALEDAFADGKLTAFKNTAIARYSLKVVSD